MLNAETRIDRAVADAERGEAGQRGAISLSSYLVELRIAVRSLEARSAAQPSPSMFLARAAIERMGASARAAACSEMLARIEAVRGVKAATGSWSMPLLMSLWTAHVARPGIFISYRDRSGEWLPAVMLRGGSRDRGGLSPRISPDGQYLFYVNGGMYWMRVAKLIDELRPK